MADIFLSYARKDLDKARQVALALIEEGWSVWWDADLRAGEQFRDVIETELASAKCVVVLWSKTSVKSRWVLDEAERALSRQVVIPVRLQAVEQPLGFSSIHAEDFVGWNGSRSSPHFVNLRSAVGRHLPLPARRVPAEARPPAHVLPKPDVPPSEPRPPSLASPKPDVSPSEESTPTNNAFRRFLNADFSFIDFEQASEFPVVIFVLVYCCTVASQWIFLDGSTASFRPPQDWITYIGGGGLLCAFGFAISRISVWTAVFAFAGCVYGGFSGFAEDHTFLAGILVGSLCGTIGAFVGLVIHGAIRFAAYIANDWFPER